MFRHPRSKPPGLTFHVQGAKIKHGVKSLLVTGANEFTDLNSCPEKMSVLRHRQLFVPLQGPHIPPITFIIERPIAAYTNISIEDYLE